MAYIVKALGPSTPWPTLVGHNYICHKYTGHNSYGLYSYGLGPYTSWPMLVGHNYMRHNYMGTIWS